MRVVKQIGYTIYTRLYYPFVERKIYFDNKPRRIYYEINAP